MRTIQAFLDTVWESLTQPSAYKNFLKRKFSSGVWYVYFVLLLTSLVSAIPFSVVLLASKHHVLPVIASVKEEVPTLYPPNLIVTIKNGVVKTNVREPYYIEIPAAWRKAIDENQAKEGDKKEMQIKHLVAIDTLANAENFAKYESVVLVTKKSIVFPDKNGSYKIQPLDDVKDFTLNKKKYDEVVAKVLPFADYVPGIIWTFALLAVLVLPFIIAAFRLVGYFIYLLITTVLLFWLNLIMKRKLHYADIYKLSFYGLTLPLVYALAAGLVGFWFPFVFTLIFLIWMGVVIGKMPRKA